MNRRNFVKKTALGSIAVTTAPAVGFAANNRLSSRDIKVGMMWGTINVGDSIREKFELSKKAELDGIEVSSHLDRKEVLKACEATKLKIPSVCGSKHWDLPLSSPDAAIRRKGRDALKVTLEDASTYGADTILLVPGVVDETTSYEECWYRTIEEIKKVIPLAEKLNVTIAIENVWNNFLLSPIEARYYLDQFSSPYVKFYFDCGNILMYGWPEQWINILGQRIAKVHIKEFSREKADNEGRWAGFEVALREGDVNWAAVMKALDNIGYKDWMTLEQGGADSLEGMKTLVRKTREILRN
ncbi:MAG: sugar phosphate isomerase/epimerase family protein [Bacteroidales bacterium]|nr:sugar phosphate isomerase/epimerase [Bacteroidales bacterium]MBS3775076.1 sugar phosphate isomerase/epimerase [Bacteroidales bacterium]